MAGVTTQCTRYVADGRTWTIVQELYKTGYIGYDDPLGLPAAASSEDLSSAIHVLMTVRERSGDTASVGARLRVRRDCSSAGTRLPWTDRVLGDVHRAAPRAVEGVGAVRAVDIWLPPARRQRTRAPQPSGGE